MANQRRTCFVGQSLNDYALLSGMIALVAIPALVFFGGGLNNGLQGVDTSNRMGGLLALIGAPGSGGTPGGAPGMGGQPSAHATAPTATFSIDPNTGKVVFEMGGGEGDGSNTTSAGGNTGFVTAMLSAELGNLANTPNLSSELQQMIRELADTGDTIGDRQSYFFELYGPDGEIQSADFIGPHAIPGVMETSLDSLYQGMMFKNKYDAVLAEIDRRVQAGDQNVDYADLRGQLSDYSTMISQMNYNNYTLKGYEAFEYTLPNMITVSNLLARNPDHSIVMSEMMTILGQTGFSNPSAIQQGVISRSEDFIVGGKTQAGQQPITLQFNTVDPTTFTQDWQPYQLPG